MYMKLPLNWCWHSWAPSKCPAPRATTASGDSTHNCLWAGDRPGILAHSIVEAKLQTTLKKKIIKNNLNGSSLKFLILKFHPKHIKTV